MNLHNADCTCWNCPALDLNGKVRYRGGKDPQDSDSEILATCKRRPEIGLFYPTSISFHDCPEWIPTQYGYLLKDMRVLIL